MDGWIRWSDVNDFENAKNAVSVGRDFRLCCEYYCTVYTQCTETLASKMAFVCNTKTLCMSTYAVTSFHNIFPFILT